MMNTTEYLLLLLFVLSAIHGAAMLLLVVRLRQPEQKEQPGDGWKRGIPPDEEYLQ